MIATEGGTRLICVLIHCFSHLSDLAYLTIIFVNIMPDCSGICASNRRKFMRAFYVWGSMTLVLCGMLCAAPVTREINETKIIDLDLTTLPNPAKGPLQWTLATASLYPSRDMRHLTYIVTEGEKSCLVRDGKRGAWHDMVQLLPDSLTSDGHFYCWLRDGEQWTLVFDDKEYPATAPDMLTSFISADGQHIAYIGRRAKDDRCIVLDGVEGKWYHSEITHPVFSPDSRRLGYGAWTGMRWVVVVDGQELPGEQSGVSDCAFSPDSRHFAAVLRIDDKYVLQIDGERGKVYDNIEQFSYTVAGKPRFIARVGERQLLVTGDEEREMPGYSRDLVISTDEKHMAYLTGPFRNTAAVIDGVTGPTYLDIRLGTNVFIGDGQTRYLARKDDGWVVVMNNTETPVGKEPIFPVISPRREASGTAGSGRTPG